MVDILDNLNCHHIKDKGDYYTCGNPDGDNTTAITLYKNVNLNVINYTRDITKGKSYNSDIITLVEFFKECSFFEAIKHICEWIELDIYHDFDKDIPEDIVSIIKSSIDDIELNGVKRFKNILKPLFKASTVLFLSNIKEIIRHKIVKINNINIVIIIIAL